MGYNLKVVDMGGAPVGEFVVEDRCVELEKGSQAVHDVVVAYLSGIRAGTASTKNRGEVSGGGAKPFRQKGTGRARAGSNRSPVWRHGGIIFGPKPRSYAKNVNKKVRKLALKRAFSERLRDGDVFVLNKLELADHKTKNMVAILNKVTLGTNALVLVKDYDDKSLKAMGNLPDALVIKESCVNVYQMLLYKKILFTEEAIKEFVGRL